MYIDRQYYSECKLVSTLNAKYYLTNEYIEPKSTEYEKLVDDCCCRIGACIGIGLMYDYLNLEVIRDYKDSYELKEAIFEYNQLPIDVSVWHKRTGLHSSCIVDSDKKTQTVKVMNFRYETSTGSWMFFEDLKRFLQSGDYSVDEMYRPIGWLLGVKNE